MQRINPELIKEATAQTSGFMPRDIDALFADVAANFVHEAFINNEKSSENEAIGSDKEDSLSKEDFLKALERSKKRNASALGAPKVKLLFIIPVVFLFCYHIILKFYYFSAISFWQLLLFRCLMLNGKMSVVLRM